MKIDKSFDRKSYIVRRETPNNTPDFSYYNVYNLKMSSYSLLNIRLCLKKSIIT